MIHARVGRNIRIMSIWFLLCFSVVVLASHSVSAAQTYGVQADAVQNSIFRDEVAEYRLQITNFGIASDTFLIYSNDPQWQTYYEGSLITVGPKETRVLSLILDPAGSIVDGRKYSVPVVVKSTNSDLTLISNLDVTVNAESIRTFLPSVFIDVTIANQRDGGVDPAEPVDVRVRLLNRNPLDISQLRVELRSPFFQESFVVHLPPSERVTKILTYQIDPQTTPQEFTIYTELFIQNKSIAPSKPTTVGIIQSQTPFARNVITDSSSFLLEEYVAELKNPGNVVSTETIQFSTSRIARFFTAYSLDDVTYVTIDDQLVAQAQVTLQPGETLYVSARTNYRTFVIVLLSLIIIGVVVMVLYYAIRSPVIITKRVDILQSDDDLTRAKVILTIKNRTTSVLNHVHVLERIPNITELEEQTSVGTMHPTKVLKSPKKGTMIRWDFSMLESYEERILTYTIRSKLSIIGSFSLPATVVKFDKNAHTRTVKEDKIESDDLVD